MRPLKGLHKDFQPINQPDDTIRYALNSINDALDGGLGSLSTEPGNELCVSLERDIIGTIPIADNEIAIFSESNGISEIGLLKNCNYTPVVQSDCLGFSKNNPIKGVSRVKNLDRIIYWTDAFNNDRFFNFDDPASFLVAGATISDTNTDKWDCDKFDLIPTFTPFSVDVVKITKYRGNLEKGSYVFAFAYEDADGNVTDYFSFTDAISIDDNEAITLQFTGIDSDYDYIRPAVIAFNLDNVTGVVTLLDSIPITSDTYEWVFYQISGLQSNLADINITSSRFIRSKAMEIVNKRLVRGNLEEDLIDWSVFQEKVNDISVRWVCKMEEAYLSSTEGQQNIITQKSLRRDEVYDIGIVFVFDGFESPAFSIPGRASITSSALINIGNLNEDIRSATGGANWDTATVTVAAHSNTAPGTDEIDEYDAQIFGLAVGDEIERWKVYNTAIKDEGYNDNRGYWSFSGYCGYYEDEQQQYPDYFGSLAGQNVRYHRMPTLSIAPVHRVVHEAFTPSGVQNKQFVHHLGLELTNVILPVEYVDQVIGYRIVYSKLDNPTVVDTGVLERISMAVGTGTNPNFITQSVPFHQSDDDSLDYALVNTITLTPLSTTTGFISPKSKFLGLDDANYYSPQLFLKGIINTVYSGGSFSAPDFGGERWLGTLLGYYEMESSSYRAIVDSKEININTITRFQEHSFLNAGKQEYAALATNFPPFYDTAGTFNYEAPYNGSSTEVGYVLTQLKRNVKPLSNRYQTRFIPFDSVIYTDPNITIYGGDTYIVDFAYRKTQRQMTADEMPDSADIVLFDDVTAVIRFFSECEINTNFREEGDGFFTTSNGDEQLDRLFWPGGSLTLAEFLKREPEYTNYYYTPDSMSVQNFWKEYIVLSSNYSFRESSYPNLISYSELSQETDKDDRYRVFRPNNLGLLPENRGPISNLVSYRQKLLVFTDQSLFQILPNPQQIETDLSSIYIGTGEFLAIPPQELVESEWGHAGTTGRFNIKHTPYGLFYIDIDQGKVYRFFDQLEDISAQGLHNYFQSNRGFKLSEEFEQIFNVSYPYEDNTLTSGGVGYRSTYDPVFERYILSKIDKKSQYPLNYVEYCFTYPEVENRPLFIEDHTSINPFVFLFSQGYTNPPGIYDATIDLTSPDPLIGTYARAYPSIIFNYQFTHQTGVYNRVDWSSPQTFLKFDGISTETFYHSAQDWQSQDFTTGLLSGEEPYQKWRNIRTHSGSNLGLFFEDAWIGGVIAYTPQLFDNDYTSITMQWDTIQDLSLTGNFESNIFYRTPPCVERIITNPSTNKVVELGVQMEYGLNANPFHNFGVIYPDSRRHFVGAETPDNDTWHITWSGILTNGPSSPDPSVYLQIDSDVKYPATVSKTNIAGSQRRIVTIEETLTLSKGQTVDVIIEYFNNEDVSTEGYTIIYPEGNSEFVMRSTTDTLREQCDYVAPEEVYTLGDYSGFDVEGYPLGSADAQSKIPHLQDSLYWIPFYVFQDDINILAGETANIASSSGIVQETGLYELYTNQMILEFPTETHGASWYTITLDYEGTTLANFVYDSALSSNNGYDTFRAVWTGKTAITMTAGTTWPEINLTANVSDFTGAEAITNYNAYTRMSNAVQTIKFNECDSFIIRNYDSLTSIAEAAIQSYGADYVVSVGANEERLLNYVIVEEDGLYDLHIQNDFDVTDPTIEIYLYINDVAQTPIQELAFDGLSFHLTLKDVTLFVGDTIKCSVKQASYNTSVFTDEYLTTLVKKDYTCVDILPYEDKSSTISYDVKNGQWASFHSYIPKMMFNDSKWYYTTEDLRNIYRHTTDNYLSFYNTLYPHVLEFVVKAPLTVLLNSIKWIGNAQEYNQNYWIEVDNVSFDQMLVYNDKQSTGLQTLDFNQSSIFWDNTIKKIIKKNKEYRVGGIRNLATGQPLVTAANTSRSVDINSNDSIIDTNRSLHLQDPLRSNYHIVRLFYHPSTADIRLITNIVETLNQYSFG